MTLTPSQRRAHYDRFVHQITDLCRDNGARADLRTGRGRPVEECPRMDRYLTFRTRGFGAKRAHYTVACLIALTRPDPPTPPETGETRQPGPSSNDASAPPGPSGAGADSQALPAPDSDSRAAAAAWRARDNLGTTLALAVRHHGLHHDRTEQRLYTYSRLDSELLQPRLPGLTTHLLEAGASPDFAVLLEDLAWWDADRDRITARWRETFYLTLHHTEPSTDPEP